MLRLYFTVLFLIIIFPAALFAANTVQQPVYERIPKGFETSGMRFGDVMLHPSAELLEVFSDNIYATQTNKKSDFITNIAPIIKAESLNRDRGFKAELVIDSYIYRQFNSENYTNAHIDLQPYWQATKVSKFDGQLKFQSLHEPRTSEAASNNIGAEEPVHYSQSIGRLGWEYKPGRIGMTSFVQHETLRFDNVSVAGGGPELLNKDRNRDENSAGINLSCDLTDRNKVYSKLVGFGRDYQHRDYDTATVGFTGVKRDSKGADLRIGYEFDATKLLRLDMNGGLYHQDFNDSQLDNVSTIVGKASATWLVTPLTTIDLFARRDVFETIQPDASAFIQNDLGGKVTHELRRNILIGLRADAGENNYQGGTRKDRYWGAGPDIVYKVNRNMNWKAEYIYDRRNSSQPNLDYDRHRVFVGLEVKF